MPASVSGGQIFLGASPLGEPDGDDRKLIEHAQRYSEQQLRDNIWRRQNGRNNKGPNNRVTPPVSQLGARDQPGAFQQHQEHGQEKANAKAKDKFRNKIQIVPDTGQRLLRYPTDIAGIATK